MRLEKDVVMTSDEGSQLLTDSLDWDRTHDVVSTPDKIFLTDSRLNASGTGLTGHPNLKSAQILEDVTVHFNTDAAKMAKDEKPVVADPSKVVTITCDGPMTVDQSQSMAIFEKNVVAIQVDRTLKADHLEVHFDQKASQIKEMICLGNVQILQGDNQTFADKAVYTGVDQRLTLTGHPKVIMITDGMKKMGKDKDEKEITPKETTPEETPGAIIGN